MRKGGGDAGGERREGERGKGKQRNRKKIYQLVLPTVKDMVQKRKV